MSRKTLIASAFVDLVDGTSTRAASPDNVWLHACMMCSRNTGRHRSAGSGSMDRLKGREIAHHAAVDERVEGGHQTFLEQRGHVLSIGRVPSDQENSWLDGLLQP